LFQIKYIGRCAGALENFIRRFVSQNYFLFVQLTSIVVPNYNLLNPYMCPKDTINPAKFGWYWPSFFWRSCKW